MNVACRTVSGPLSIKGDHSDIMYTLNTGGYFVCKLPPGCLRHECLRAEAAEQVKLPVIVAFDGFFTSHQKQKCLVFEDDQTVLDFVGSYDAPYSALDPEHPRNHRFLYE